MLRNNLTTAKCVSQRHYFDKKKKMNTAGYVQIIREKPRVICYYTDKFS